MPKCKKIGLTEIRALGCIMILLHHANGSFLHLEALYMLGRAGVMIFFLLSGMLFYYNHADDYGDKQPCRIWHDGMNNLKKNIKKFYPLHLITFLLMSPITLGVLYLHGMIKEEVCTKVVAAVANILLVQSWWNNQEIYMSYNGVSWFLSSILLSYFFAPTLLKMVKSLSDRGQKILIALISIGILALSISLIGNTWATWVIYICPITRMIEFLFGMLLAKMKERMPSEKRGGNSEIFGIAIMLIFLYVGNYLPDAVTQGIWFIVPSCILLLVFYDGKGKISERLNTKPVMKIAELSMYIYFIHQVIDMYMEIFNKYIYPINQYLLFLLGIFLPIMGAYFIEKLIKRL